MGSLQIKLDLETYKQLKIFCVKQEQKIRDNAMDMWSDNIEGFINKFYGN